MASSRLNVDSPRLTIYLKFAPRQQEMLNKHVSVCLCALGVLHSDVDKGDGKVKYVLSGEGATSIFTIDENTGDIHATKRLDREAQAYYTLQAQAVDRLTNLPVEPRSEFVVKVQDINDNEPKFLDGPYLAGVPEMSPLGTMVVQVAATDADDPTYGNSARVVYSIIHGQPYFSVEPKTGVIRTALPNMDRETRDQYVLVIQAKDMVGQMGGLSGTTSVTVTLTDVNDNPPRFTHKNYQYTVLESLPVQSVVARIKAADADIGSNAEMDYRIMDGDGPGMFNITTDEDTQEGVIILLKPLDFETKGSFSLRIEATNRNIDSNFLSLGPFSDTTTVKVTVEDVNEPPIFSAPVSKMVVFEDAKVGTSIGRVSAHDPDTSNNGISTAKNLDREANSVHNLTICATETQCRDSLVEGCCAFEPQSLIFVGSARTSPMTRSLRPEAPRVLFITIKSAGPNVSASSLAGMAGNARPNHHLALRRSHLAISVCQADRGVKPAVQDGSPARASFPDNEPAPSVISLADLQQKDPAQIGKGIALITVQDINDNAPVFAIDYETLLCENALPGQVIQTISAVDKDEPVSGHRFYFALAAPVAGNLNFTLRDNKGEATVFITPVCSREGARRKAAMLHFRGVNGSQVVPRQHSVHTDEARWLQEAGAACVPAACADRGQWQSCPQQHEHALGACVCDCNSDGVALSCGAVAYTATGLSTGALLAILGCIITLLAYNISKCVMKSGAPSASLCVLLNCRGWKSFLIGPSVPDTDRVFLQNYPLGYPWLGITVSVQLF
ncbi:hypothetical protein L3Q82_004671 [Scortum barcoo]|uniref:Uncharacterized protein n=1 Tax=Scortum barcoo TaxID=214431 RepID=A0ACB8VH17_9TELE|nr:hypothetical protein L3Q82_004671 [Scortum barcoo]